ncbi:MAG: alpha/beta hydrolase [Nitratireductor sp.]|nr:alpha/beta hydrolase [Nitratireductor sp.]
MKVATITTAGKQVDLSYLDQGEGMPVLLVHGFASNKEINWANTGWLRDLNHAGFRTIAFDNRGHGASTKFYQPGDYSLEWMAEDAINLLDHLGVGQAHLIGYSMGARISTTLAMHHGARFDRVVLSGNGWGMVEGSGDWTPVHDALLAPSLDAVTDARGRAFRAFADQTGSDRAALAACVTGVRELIPETWLPYIQNEVMVAIGTEDDLAGSGEKLADALPNGRYLAIPGRDHMKAVGDRVHKQGAIAFLTEN